MNRDFDVTYFRYARRLDGSLEPIDVARRNGRLVPQFDPSWTTPPAELNESASEFDELIAEITNGLTAAEVRTWLKLVDGISVDAIATEEGITRSAIYERIRGNSKQQGGMVKKNDYVRIWWERRQNLK